MAQRRFQEGYQPKASLHKRTSSYQVKTVSSVKPPKGGTGEVTKRTQKRA